MPNKTVLIDARPALTLEEFYQLLGASLWPARPHPRNLDGLADLLREESVSALVLSACRLPIPAFTQLAEMCRGEGIRLHTHS